MAGKTSKVSFQLTIARTSQKGTMIAVKGRMRPIVALRSDSGRPDTAASVWTGVPMAPQATGAVLAIRLSTAAWNGSNPRPIMNAPAIATGAPNPAAPSIRAPKQKATSSTCSRRSGVIPAIDCFIISNWPVLTDTSYRNTAVTTIQAILRSPKAAQNKKLVRPNAQGMWNARQATARAEAAPAAAARWGLTRATATSPSKTIIGIAATSVDNHQTPKGS